MQSQIIESLGPLLKGGSLLEATGQEEEWIGEMLGAFETLRIYTSYMLVEAVTISQNQYQSYLCLLAMNDTLIPARSPLAERQTTDFELVGLAVLKKDYGRVYIRPETFTDKLLDLVTHSDVDFDYDPEFSKKYYVVSNNPNSLRYKVTPRFLQAIKKYDSLEIEIEGKVLMVRLRKSFTLENALLIANFISEINTGAN